MNIAFYAEHRSAVIVALETRLKHLEDDFDLTDIVTFETDTHTFRASVSHQSGTALDQEVNDSRDKTLEDLSQNVSHHDRIRDYVEKIKSGSSEPAMLFAIRDELLAALVEKAIFLGTLPLPSEADKRQKKQDLPVLKVQLSELRVYSTALAEAFGVRPGLN